MAMQQNEYQANNADSIVSEFFSGGISVADAIERLRTRLLDLSARNPLLNYRHPKKRCIQIVGEPNINLVFDRLYVDGRAVPFKYVPEPPPHSYEGRLPEAKLYAEQLGISTSFEFVPNPAGSDGHRARGLQTLFYPADLERQLRKIANEAKTAIEETGTNMLFLVFGFLEFYDSEDSEQPMLAPLLSLPVTLVRGNINQETGTYQYSVKHNGEDLAENQTLREKLRCDFMIDLPDFGESDEPEIYFSKIEKIIWSKRRWKVRRQMTLGMFSFGKLAMWADLDTKKNPGILEKELIKLLLSGSTGPNAGSLYAEDYRIDESPWADQPLIYDADSSQHSAIIDVLLGKNLVINGPPGTGKSQTITNIIAASLSKGQKVLFVSEKLTALEVVRRRLDQAGLGRFCLELHSHKTEKKKLLEDIKDRIEARFSAPEQFDDKLATLRRLKSELARYAELMGSQLCNALGLTVNEIFWAVERRRQDLGDLSSEVYAIRLTEATKWTHADIVSKRSRLTQLAELYDTIGGFDLRNPWWGFRPNRLVPSDDKAIARTLLLALKYAEMADSAANAAVEFFSLEAQPDAATVSNIARLLKEVPALPLRADTSLLPRMFDENDPKGDRSSKLLANITSKVTKARDLFKSAAEVFSNDQMLPEKEINEIRQTINKYGLFPELLSSDISKALGMVSELERATDVFAAAANTANAPYSPNALGSLAVFLSNMGNPLMSGLASYPIDSIAARAESIRNVAKSLEEAVYRLQDIADRHGIPFDATPEAIAKLADPQGLPGLSKGISVTVSELEEGHRLLLKFPLADRAVSDLEKMKQKLSEEVEECSKALERCRQAAERIGLSFDSTETAVAEISTIASVAASAPSDLMEYRRSTFGHAKTSELIQNIRTAIAAEKVERAALESLFYLDILPETAEIKAAVATLRQKDGLLAFFDGKWRKARKLYSRLSKEKRKMTARQCADELARLAKWMEAKAAIVSNMEYKECFGDLFRGLDTDVDKLTRLDEWYRSSRAALVKCPGLVDKVDLTAIELEQIFELAAKAEDIRADTIRLTSLEDRLKEIFGANINIVGFKQAKARRWTEGLELLRKVFEKIDCIFTFFADKGDKSLSPQDILRLMEAQAELKESSSDLLLLMEGRKKLQEAGGDELESLANIAAGGAWSKVLPDIESKAKAVAETAALALAFADASSPLADAEAFARAKSELDRAWTHVAPMPTWTHFSDWKEWADAARKTASAARSILEHVARYCKPGASIDNFFRALDEKAEANAILKKLSESENVRRILGGAFKGVNTDLESLLEIHAWGSAVGRLELPTAVCRRLLSEDAGNALAEAKRLFTEIDEGCRKARETVEKLASFGPFSWEDWQEQVRSVRNRDFPSEIKIRLEAATRHPESVLPWSNYLSLRHEAIQDGLEDFVSALESKRIPSSALVSAFELAMYQSIARAIYQSFPELKRFSGNTLENARKQYRSLDAEIISITGKKLADEISKKACPPEGQRGTSANDFTEMNLLRREINKKRRHIPIRQLLKRAGRALQELKPCFMMGPLSVAQYLEQGALKFDLVIMDEASQLRPEEALGAIARGTQLVVVGDAKQLPPTSFFDRMLDAGGDEDEDDSPVFTSGMESILDICQQLFTPVRSLRWHYRSQHESLIAFSNYHFYKNLIIFPSPYAKNPRLGVKYRYVEGGIYKDRRNVPEAQRVVDAVLEHMLKRPNESLGVVTLNLTQRELIEELLDRKLKTFEEGAKFIGRWETEGWPFFIKNLENVQGDERDVIFISTTFGKVQGTDKVRQNFGPISRPDGWRRLNVLFTRARWRIELFTSLSPEDIVVDERTPLGTRVLRDYLEFAKSGVLATIDESERDPDSDFEISVANVVRSLGYEVKPQLGVAGFFIDIAVRNPDRPGEFLAGIECDGATYHSGFSVRERDRIRQDILESLGWKDRIYRIWSTDWFYNPRSEIERLQRFLEERRRASADMEDIAESEGHFEDVAENAEDQGLAEELTEAAGAASGGAEDLFVEVGDTVTYCFIDDPNEHRSVRIVDSESNLKMNMINERTPLAQALLGLSPGEVGDLQIPGQKTRQVRILKIQRQL